MSLYEGNRRLVRSEATESVQVAVTQVRQPILRIPGATMPGRVFPHDPSTWFIYVLDFKERFDLDLGQMSTAESIHIEVSTLANHYIKAHTEMLKTISLVERMTHEAYEPVRSLFGGFQSRLDAIPTSSQRELSER